MIVEFLTSALDGFLDDFKLHEEKNGPAWLEYLTN